MHICVYVLDILVKCCQHIIYVVLAYQLLLINFRFWNKKEIFKGRWTVTSTNTLAIQVERRLHKHEQDTQQSPSREFLRAVPTQKGHLRSHQVASARELTRSLWSRSSLILAGRRKLCAAWKLLVLPSSLPGCSYPWAGADPRALQTARCWQKHTPNSYNLVSQCPSSKPLPQVRVSWSMKARSIRLTLQLRKFTNLNPNIELLQELLQVWSVLAQMFETPDVSVSFP